MRHAQAGLCSQRLHAPRQQSQAGGVAFGRVLEQQLHAQTYAQQRLAQFAQHADQASLMQTLHTRRGSTDTGQDHVRRVANRSGRIAQLRVDADARKIDFVLVDELAAYRKDKQLQQADHSPLLQAKNSQARTQAAQKGSKTLALPSLRRAAKKTSAKSAGKNSKPAGKAGKVGKAAKGRK